MPLVTDLTIPFQPAAEPAELETRRALLSADSKDDAAFERHCELAGLHWALGESENALASLQKALHLAHQNSLTDSVGYLLSLQSAALCYIGQYAAAHALFAQTESLFRRQNDELGVAWQQHLMAREYYLDLGNFAAAQRAAAQASSFFRANNLWHAYAESLLTQAHSALGAGEPRRAADFLKQAEGLIAERNLKWLAPEYHWLRARTALAEGTPRLAARHCHNALNAVNNGGDVRLLTALYVTLGKALEPDRSQQADAQDAFERALAARERARCLHVAQAYLAIGLHLKRYSQRMTMRARGSGYLFEAERRYKALGLPMPEA
jgi:tetratricopeptide (TPR) repeat protein